MYQKNRGLGYFCVFQFYVERLAKSLFVWFVPHKKLVKRYCVFFFRKAILKPCSDFEPVTPRAWNELFTTVLPPSHHTVNVEEKQALLEISNGANNISDPRIWRDWCKVSSVQKGCLHQSSLVFHLQNYARLWSSGHLFIILFVNSQVSRLRVVLLLNFIYKAVESALGAQQFRLASADSSLLFRQWSRDLVITSHFITGWSN